MKLLDTFFWILEEEGASSSWQFRLRLNPDHIIYTGHFPGFPVTPAAIQVNMVHELTEKVSGGPIRLLQLTTSKFLKVIDPLVSPIIACTLTLTQKQGQIHVKAVIQDEKAVFSRLSLIYQSEKA